jgi:hypothetical protein
MCPPKQRQQRRSHWYSILTSSELSKTLVLRFMALGKGNGHSRHSGQLIVVTKGNPNKLIRPQDVEWKRIASEIEKSGAYIKAGIANVSPGK